jgi:hypothetical protein
VLPPTGVEAMQAKHLAWASAVGLLRHWPHAHPSCPDLTQVRHESRLVASPPDRVMQLLQPCRSCHRACHVMLQVGESNQVMCGVEVQVAPLEGRVVCWMRMCNRMG